MTPLAAGAALGIAAAATWPGLRRWPAWPFHLLRGESLATDVALAGIGATIGASRVLGLLLVRDAAGFALAAAALGATVTLSRRDLRSAAAPLLEDAVWIGGLGLAATCGGRGGPVAAGAVGGGLVAVGLVAALVALWGRGNAFAVTARPDFQVFAPNPDNRYALGRVRVREGRRVLALVPDNRCRFAHVSVYDARMRCVHWTAWPDLRAALAARGHLRVELRVVGSAPAADADLSVALPAGRYSFSVRNYLAARPDAVALPRARAWDGLGAAPWASLERP